MKEAIYAFSGDPITFGHLDIIERAAKVFDKLIVAIGVNPAKKYLFTLEERAQLAKQVTGHISNVQVVYFKGLLVDYAYENNISTIIRGLRNSEDFSFELMLHQIGESQKMSIDTFFIPSKQELSHISSGAAKAIQLEQGLIHEYVPIAVKQKLEERLSGQFIIGITGEIGSGKSFISQALKELLSKSGQEIHLIDIDKIGHEILEELEEPLFQNFRRSVAKEFGDFLLKPNGFINTKELGKIVFADINQLNKFNAMLYKPLLLKLRRELYGKRGIILLDSALIVETQMSYLCNNNIILINSPRAIRLSRLQNRGYSSIQINERMNSQYNYQKKLDLLQSTIHEKSYGNIIHFFNDGNDSNDQLKKLAEQLSGLVSAKVIV